MFAFLLPYKLYLYAGGAGLLIVAAVWWHTSALAKAKQEATANARAEGYNEFRNTVYRQEKAQWEADREELEDRLVELSKRRNTVTERIITIERAKDEERTQVDTLDIHALLDDVLTRAIRSESNAPPSTSRSIPVRPDNPGAAPKD